MFRIDDYEVVDATVHGNAARFINHSCEPNCYSRVVSVDGQKHIVIFATRRIYKGEELTYDYKFPIEEPGNKLPCNCGAKKCRKFLNWKQTHRLILSVNAIKSVFLPGKKLFFFFLLKQAQVIRRLMVLCLVSCLIFRKDNWAESQWRRLPLCPIY